MSKRTQQFESEIAYFKIMLRQARDSFSNHLLQSELFTEGTYERIMEKRFAEEMAFCKKLDKLKRSIPNRLRKKINAYLNAVTLASRLQVSVAAYAHEDPFCDDMPIADEVRDHFIKAKQTSVHAYHDFVKHLMLQDTLAVHKQEIEFAQKYVMNLHYYVRDVFNINKYQTVLKDIAAIERTQRNNKFKRIAGISLRVLGWSIIIVASVVSINPAIGLALTFAFMGVTIFGELLNIAGKRLAKPAVLKEEMQTVRQSLSFFKTPQPRQPEIASVTRSNPSSNDAALSYEEALESSIGLRA